MKPRFDILCLSSIDWDFNWQGHQEVMSRLAASGHRVLFVENTGVRAPSARDLPRLAKRFRNWLSAGGGLKSEAPNLSIFSPVILPLPYARGARRINESLLALIARRWIDEGEGRPLVFWSFLPTPLAMDLIDDLHPSVVVYYCVDDLASSSPEAHRIRDTEERLIRRADLAFATSASLTARLRVWRRSVHTFPFGVDFEAFAAVRRSNDLPPEDVARLPSPRVGYVGGIHRWIDQRMCRDLARSFPEVSFVFVGPPQTNVATLKGEKNIHLVGARPHTSLPQYIKCFDAGLIPYTLSEYTAHVYPTKLNEYLALGLPVVSTELPEVRAFNARHGDVIAVAESVTTFAHHLRNLLRAGKEHGAGTRIAVARRNDWAPRVDRMETLVGEAQTRGLCRDERESPSEAASGSSV